VNSPLVKYRVSVIARKQNKHTVDTSKAQHKHKKINLKFVDKSG